YVLNDLADLGNDRRHPSKRHRPLASGAVPLLHGLVLAPAVLAAAIGLALPLPIEFITSLGAYFALTLAYSLWLKRAMPLDVVMLACLYGARLYAGGVAVAVPLSPWLAAFSIFMFLSLAVIKRCTELIGHIEKGKGDPAGRGYTLHDLSVLEAMAAASGYVAVMVFALYISSPAVVALYSHPGRLWLICIGLIYWITRMLILTHRGEMHDDPVVFAAKDRASLISAAFIASVVLASV
ncbi:MAG: UbiA family prenyltransferase, partial [Roseiarcus sp.]